MNKKVKVLHYIPGFDHGGIESRLLDWYRNVDRDKVQFDLIKLTSGDNKLIDEFKALGGNVYTIPQFSSRNIARYNSELKKILSSNEYHIAHCHSPSTGYFFLRQAKKFSIPVRIMHSRTTSFNNDASFVFVRNLLKDISKKYVTNYFACSPEAGNWLFGEASVQNGNVKIINNGIESEKFRYNPNTREQMRKEMGLEDSFVVGSVARFSTQKNHSFLIDIFYEVSKKNQNSKLILLGSGPTEKEIKNKVRELNITEKVLFLGSKDNIDQYLQCMDVFVLPSHFEGFGTVVIESQAAGLKSYVSDKFPKSVEITDLVERLPLSLSPKEWAEKIESNIKGYGRRDTILEIKQAGFDAKYTAKDLEDFYINTADIL